MHTEIPLLWSWGSLGETHKQIYLYFGARAPQCSYRFVSKADLKDREVHRDTPGSINRPYHGTCCPGLTGNLVFQLHIGCDQRQRPRHQSLHAATWNSA